MIQTILLLEQDLVKFLDRDNLNLKDSLQLLNPRFLPVFIFRISNAFYRHNLGFIAKLLALKNQIIFGCDIARGARISGGLYLPHPNGIVIGEHVRIGRNCIIHQGVTLGARGEDHEFANPTVGHEVEIGTGAKILGFVRIGDYARVGANAVVLHDVPDYGIAVGIPAKTIGLRPNIT
ncbi:MAG: serine acetyltransferase [Candidatus Cloacimonetes bacterium HGW-Cloacimonetes-1]|nr:MAG: serine acetyltransferase [Candidatus Cloacimonetes bacterium HGW-Cloacimonetes-1]